MEPPPVPDLPSRAESKAMSSVLLFVKVEQDTLLSCSTEERVEEADQQLPFPVILSRIHGAEVLVCGLLLPGLGEYHIDQQHG